MESDTKIEIGKKCMFSSDVSFWCSDVHSVVDRHTGKLLNRPVDIVIGDRFWIGKKVTFNKNTSVADHSIVGRHSLVTKKFTQPHIVIAGNPARMVKEDIDWHWSPPSLYNESNVALSPKGLDDYP
jgi:acetyltransferase-like isoleucine patch superfamily enzyme